MWTQGLPDGSPYEKSNRVKSKASDDLTRLLFAHDFLLTTLLT
jgi:hypothetical protein